MMQTIFLLIGLFAVRATDPGDSCPTGACPEVPHRPVIAWTAPQSLRADEVGLFCRGERRPGQPGASVTLWREPHEKLVIGSARERLLVLRVQPARR